MPQSARSAPGSARRLQDPLEAARRNAAEREAKERHFAQYVAEFRAQGYGKAAAEALASKRFAEEGPQPREWSSNAIKQERDLAEFQPETPCWGSRALPGLQHVCAYQ